MADRVLNVLFLCTGNSARSILAEATLNQLGKGRFRAYSAGSKPAGTVNPHALAQLQRAGFSTEGLASKPWSEFEKPDAPVMDFVITVCDAAAGEPCPTWPGHPITAHWGVPDPSRAEGGEEEKVNAFREAFFTLQRRIELFVSLPFASLDRLAIGDQMSDIAKV